MYVHVHMHMHVCACVHACVHACVCVCMRACVHVCVCLSVCLSVCMCLCLCRRQRKTEKMKGLANVAGVDARRLTMERAIKQQEDQMTERSICTILNGLFRSHLAHIINHCNSLGHFMPLYNRMIVQVLAFS